MNWDDRLYFAIYSLHEHTPWLNWIMINLAQDGLYIYGVLLIWLWFAGRSETSTRHFRETSLTGLYAGILGLLLNIIIAHIWFRTRPFVTLHTTPLISHSADASFPSDHTTGSMGIAAGVYTKSRRTGLYFGTLAVLIGFARVYVGVHYPTDILGGIAVGLLSAFLVAKGHRIADLLTSSLLAIWNRIFPAKVPN